MRFEDLPPELLDKIHSDLSAEDSLSLCYACKIVFCKSLAGKQVFKKLFSRCWLGNESYKEAKFMVLEVQKSWGETEALKELNDDLLTD